MSKKETQDDMGMNARTVLDELRATLYSIGDAVIVTDTACRITRMNPVAESLTGWSEDEASERHLDEVFCIVSEKTGKKTAHPAERVLREGKMVELANDTLLIARDGTECPIADCGAPIFDKLGAVIGVVLVFRDQTSERAAKKALKESEELHRITIENIMDPVFITDAEGKFTFICPNVIHILGYSVEEIEAMGNISACVGEVRNLFDFEDLNKKGVISNIEAVIANKSGVKRNYLVTVRQVSIKGGAILYVCHDITELKQAAEDNETLQRRLLQSQKMEAVGRLAGGIAHDFNNVLSIILGYSDLALDEVDPAQPISGKLEEIQKAAQHATDLTRQLLAFARKQTISPEVLELNDTLTGMFSMLKMLITEGIDLVWLPGDKLWSIKMDPSQVDQILANLCVNARDAIAGVGKVTIETTNIVFDETYCTDHPGFVPGEYVQLAVSDNGCGMEKRVVDCIFEPFFTTKEMGRGTGLGLATVYGIIKQNNGFINVYSEPGEGTTFRIYFPRYLGKSERILAESQPHESAKGRETILLVEDKSELLDLCKMMLESLGYRVVAASTPGEAIALAEKYAGMIDLLITDVVMPEMNGRDLCKRLLAIYPNLKRLFMSGYTANVIVHHGVLEEGVCFIQKPFSRKDLNIKVRDALQKE